MTPGPVAWTAPALRFGRGHTNLDARYEARAQSVLLRGTLAIKRRVLEESDVRQRWLKAGCEDVPLVQALRDLKLEVRFVPSLIMIDRGDTSLKRCLPFLDRQLRAIKPDFVCALGAVSARALLGTLLPISQLRGQFHDSDGLRIMPTYHPAYLLRNPERKRDVWEDMKLLMRSMGIDH